MENGKTKSRTQVWQELCEEIDGQLVSDRSGDYSSDILRSTHKGMTISLDIEAETPSPFLSDGHGEAKLFTRYRVPFNPKVDLRAKIYREGLLSKVGKLAGMQDMVLGYPEFDDIFIVQGNDKDKIAELFSDSELRDLLLQERGFILEITKTSGMRLTGSSGFAGMMQFKATGAIQDKDRLKRQHLIVALLIDQLIKSGVI